MPQSIYGNTEYSAEAGNIANRRKLAEALMQQGLQGAPAGQMTGRFYVPTSPLLHLAKALQLGAGMRGTAEADEQAVALGRQQEGRRSADLAMLAQALGGRQASQGGLTEDASGNVTQADPVAAQTPVQALSQAIPMMGTDTQPTALQALMGAQQRADQQDFQRRQSQEALAFRSHESELAAQRARERQQSEQAFREQQARQAALDREGMLRMSLDARQDQRPPVAVVGANGKPEFVLASQAAGRQPFNAKSGQGLPPTALKMQNEMLEEIAVASNIQNDLAALNGQLATGEFSVGPISNQWNALRNAAGFSSTESQNYNTFRTTLERLRNDSLRLNKGVQTEGDAQRAWNELMGSLNDPEVVRKRLDEIQAINQRAVSMKKLQIEALRSNFGMDSLDTAGFTNQPPAVATAKPNAERRQSPRQGKTVVVNY